MGSRTCQRTGNARHNRRVLLAFTVMLALAGGAACSRNADDQEAAQPMPVKTIEQVLEEHTDEWMSIPGVVGTGIGKCEGEPCIRIFVARKTAELDEKIPARMDGYLIDIQETGRFQARDTTPSEG